MRRLRSDSEARSAAQLTLGFFSAAFLPARYFILPACWLLYLWLLATQPVLRLPLLAYLSFLWSPAGARAVASCRWPPPLRRCTPFAFWSNYAPGSRLVKTAGLPPSRRFLLALHPHGVFSNASALGLGTEALGFSDLFPGLRLSLGEGAGAAWCALLWSAPTKWDHHARIAELAACLTTATAYHSCGLPRGGRPRRPPGKKSWMTARLPCTAHTEYCPHRVHEHRLDTHCALGPSPARHREPHPADPLCPGGLPPVRLVRCLEAHLVGPPGAAARRRRGRGRGRCRRGGPCRGGQRER